NSSNNYHPVNNLNNKDNLIDNTKDNNPNTIKDILVFLPGEDDINDLYKLLRRIPNISVIKMHSTLTDTEQSIVYNSSNRDNNKNINKDSTGNKIYNNIPNPNLNDYTNNSSNTILPNPTLTLNTCINNSISNTNSSNTILPNPTLTLNTCINSSTLTLNTRVILSTNICETSLTIPGIRYVIDCGISKIKVTYNNVNYIGCIISNKLSSDQRAGRCNRMSGGICYRLYTKEMYNMMCSSIYDNNSNRSNTKTIITKSNNKSNTKSNTKSIITNTTTALVNTTPEIQRCSVIDTLLFLIVNYIDVGNYCYINKPYKDNCKESIRRLLEIGCITVNKGYFGNTGVILEGVNHNSMLEGVSNSRDRVGGVNDKSRLEGINDKSMLEGVSNSRD
ncbi:hypothetical protein CWI36_3256p0010, partial [Hamiltosporidium magnivora]